MKKQGVLSLTQLWNPEIDFAGFLMPWGMVIGSLGFLLAWVTVIGMERLGWTRHVWHLPLFFVALAVLFGFVLGLVFAP